MVDFKQLRRENPLELIQLRSQVTSCTACTARQEAICPVPGVGRRTGIVMIGRNPGKTEDLQGVPFIGNSGRVLTGWLKGCGLSRADVFLTNMVLCHTNNDRAVTKEEIATCTRLHLFNYLRLLDPYLVITFGEPCAKALVSVKKFSEKHGEVLWHQAGFWVIPCYHPGAVLYDGRALKQLEFDAVQIRRFLSRKDEYIVEWRKRRGPDAGSSYLPNVPA